jgi:hypothetical protein
MKQVELARKLGVSRQRIWQLQKIKAGCCMKCGSKRNNYAIYCNDCQKHKCELQNALYRRNRLKAARQRKEKAS